MYGAGAEKIFAVDSAAVGIRLNNLGRCERSKPKREGQKSEDREALKVLELERG
jgi:hypothetical protein